MLRLMVLTLTTLLSASAIADVSIRVPILLRTDDGKKVFNPRELPNELKRAGLNIPEYIEIRDADDIKKFETVAAEVDDAKIVLRGGQEIAVLMYERMSSLQGKGVDFPMCYTYSGLTIKKASRAAYKILTGLPGQILSDQWVVQGLKFYDEKGFEGVGGGDEDEVKDMNRQFGRKRLRKGDVQVVASTTDDGDDFASEVLRICK